MQKNLYEYIIVGSNKAAQYLARRLKSKKTAVLGEIENIDGVDIYDNRNSLMQFFHGLILIGRGGEDNILGYEVIVTEGIPQATKGIFPSEEKIETNDNFSTKTVPNIFAIGGNSDKNFTLENANKLCKILEGYDHAN